MCNILEVRTWSSSRFRCWCFFMFLLPPHMSQMDPKLRPSFPDLVKRLEEIQIQLKADDSERERMLLTAGEVEKKNMPKGACLFMQTFISLPILMWLTCKLQIWSWKLLLFVPYYVIHFLAPNLKLDLEIEDKKTVPVHNIPEMLRNMNKLYRLKFIFLSVICCLVIKSWGPRHLGCLAVQ